jgi:UDP-N-acetylmuramoyl-tripeptide--D-alanyl-D-alanine ligase
MPEFRPGELSQWVSRLWKNGIPDGVISGVSHDTRTIEPGNLYIAIQGDNFDGHDFLKQAFEKGAAGALVNERCRWSDNPVVSVQDTLKGLQDMARGYRKKWSGTAIAITGSVGKTTVKEMCADVLSMKGVTHRTAGNYNNHIGLPLTMMRMPQTARYGVFEIGMNHAGEIGPLTDLLLPKIGIITEVGSAHRKHFQSVKEIAREKARLVERIPGSGTVILNRDSEWYTLLRNHTRARVVTVSLGGVGDYVAQSVGRGIMNVNGFDYAMPLPGEHIMKNALLSIALGLELRMGPAEVAAGLQKFKLPPMRWEESEIFGIRFINDAYNANPLSMRANLETFSNLPEPGKKWAVVGGMLELGDTSEEEHAGLGRFIDGLNLDGVIIVGELGQLIVCHGVERVFHTLEVGEAAQILKDNLSGGDRVLLKASRGVGLERVLERFKEI